MGFFEKFTRKSRNTGGLTSQYDFPCVSFGLHQNKGKPETAQLSRIVFNRKAKELLNRVGENVELFFDREDKQIGVVPVPEKTPVSYSVRPPSGSGHTGTLTCITFFKEYKIAEIVGEHRIYKAEMEQTITRDMKTSENLMMLVIDLTKPLK